MIFVLTNEVVLLIFRSVVSVVVEARTEVEVVSGRVVHREVVSPDVLAHVISGLAPDPVGLV